MLRALLLHKLKVTNQDGGFHVAQQDLSIECLDAHRNSHPQVRPALSHAQTEAVAEREASLLVMRDAVHVDEAEANAERRNLDAAASEAVTITGRPRFPLPRTAERSRPRP